MKHPETGGVDLTKPRSNAWMDRVTTARSRSCETAGLLSTSCGERPVRVRATEPARPGRDGPEHRARTL